MDGLKGKRILITGASSGIGLATAVRLAHAGADLVLVARGAVALEEAAERARRLGANTHAIAVDLTDRDATTAAVHQADVLLGGLDVVVSNAGAVSFGHFLDVDPDDFDRTIAITFTGAVNLIRAALPLLRERRGTIVAVSSMMANLPLPSFAAYTASKHALRGFINTLSVEEREQRSGVRFAMVNPGPIDTPIYARATSASGRRPATLFDAYDPDEIAKAVAKAIRHPRHERTVGGESKLITALYGAARPLGEIPLVLVDRWYRLGTEPASVPGSLWSPNEHARTGGGHPGRRSGDVTAMARNLLTAATQARRLGLKLWRPVPESGSSRGGA